MKALKTKIRSIIKSFKERGLKNTALITIAFCFDYWRNFCFGLDIASWAPVGELGLSADEQKNSSPYAATTSLSFSRILKKVNVSKNQQFIDLGSGKGHVLLLALEEGFKEVVGVEFSPAMMKIAKANCSKALSVEMECNLNLYQLDAANYEFSSKDQVVFMFDPFSMEVLLSVVENIKKTVLNHSNKVTIIYRSPVHRSIFLEDESFSIVFEGYCFGHSFDVYQIN